MMDVGKAIAPAFEHMIKLLFKPFKFKLWLSLAFVSLFAASGGNFRLNVPSGNPGAGEMGGMPDVAQIVGWVQQHQLYVISGVALLVLIGIVMAWVSSVLRMVYIDQISRRSSAIKEPFSRLMGIGTSYFLWQLAFIAVVLAVAIPMFIPIARDFQRLSNPDFAVVFGSLAHFILMAFVIGVPASIVGIIANDFVATTMYARNIKAIDAWRTVIPIIRQNAGQTVLYFLLLIVLGVASMTATWIVFFAGALVLALPVGLLVGMGYLVFAGFHLSWTPAVIVVTALAGFAVLLLCGFFILGLCQPILVFRRTFPMVVLGQADESLVTIRSEEA